MDTKQIINELGSLMKLDYDAARAYEQALEKIHDQAIHHTLFKFLNDHHRHVTDLSNTIRSLGGEAPSPSPDIKGFMIEGFSSMRSMTGIKGALEAMRMNEKVTNKHYAAAAKMDFPESIRLLVENNYGDEQRHLAYIESALNVTAGA
jgi:rubrerythrin